MCLQKNCYTFDIKKEASPEENKLVDGIYSSTAGKSDDDNTKNKVELRYVVMKK